MRKSSVAMLGLALMVAGAGVAQAVDIDWVTVGNPENEEDTTGYGEVEYEYSTAKYEVTNAQYAEFLNAVATTDTYDLYSFVMYSGAGGITRSGDLGSYTYSTIAGREDMPVIAVSFHDALRFANWLHNGQLTGEQDSTTTEDGSYTMITESYPSGPFITRNADATVVLPSEDEWYKAAYYDPVSTSYFAYPAGSNTETTCAAPGTTENTANCNWGASDLADVGSYTESVSPYGTFDQGGNAAEWNEDLFDDYHYSRVTRGGSYYNPDYTLAASNRYGLGAPSEGDYLGFRVARVPEPGAVLLGACALVTLALLRRRARPGM